MAERRRLTLADLDDSSAALTQQAVNASQARRRLTLADLTGEAPKAPLPFEGDNTTLKVFNPVGGDFDTGLPISPTTARVLAGAGKTFSDIGNRARQVARRPGAQQDIDQAVERDKPLMETTAGMVGSALPYMVAGAPIANTVRASTMFGGATGLMTPTTSEEGLSAEFLNPMMQGLGGAAGQKVGNMAVNGMGKVLNTAPNAIYAAMPQAAQRFAAKHGLPKPDVRFADAEQRRVYDLLKSKGVEPSIGDIEPRSLARSFEDTVEPVGLGRRQFLEQQQDDLKDMLELTRQGINKPVLDPVTGKPMPDSYAMAQGLKDQYQANKLVSKANFDKVTQLAQEPGVLPIKPDATHAQAKVLLGEKPEYFAELQDNPLWRKMMGLERDAGPQTSVILQHTGIPFKKPQLLDFEEVRALRTALGTEYRDAEKPSRKKAYALMLKALDEDLDAWGQNTGNKTLNGAYADARSYHKQNVVPYTDPNANPSKSPIFSNVASRDTVDSDTVPAGVFKTNRGQLAQDFMDLASPQGQQAGKNALIDEIIGAGLNPDTETGLSNALIRHSTRYSAPGSAVFSPAEQAAVNSSVDTLAHTRRAAGLSATPPKTGFRAVPWMAGSALMGGAGVPLYYGLNAALGDQLSPSERVASAFVLAPIAAAAMGKGGVKYTQGGLSKLLHFADPNLEIPMLGALQRTTRSLGKGAGVGVEENYRRGALGHRADEEQEATY